MPSWVGLIEQLMPPSRAPLTVRSATIRSSNCTTGRPVVTPTTLPASSIFQPSAGPASTMSCSSGYTNTYCTRSRPPRYLISSGSLPLFSVSAFWQAASRALSEILRNLDSPVRFRRRLLEFLPPQPGQRQTLIDRRILDDAIVLDDDASHGPGAKVSGQHHGRLRCGDRGDEQGGQCTMPATHGSATRHTNTPL